MGVEYPLIKDNLTRNGAKFSHVAVAVCNLIVLPPEIPILVLLFLSQFHSFNILIKKVIV